MLFLVCVCVLCVYGDSASCAKYLTLLLPLLRPFLIPFLISFFAVSFPSSSPSSFLPALDFDALLVNPLRLGAGGKPFFQVTGASGKFRYRSPPGGAAMTWSAEMAASTAFAVVDGGPVVNTVATLDLYVTSAAVQLFKVLISLFSHCFSHCVLVVFYSCNCSASRRNTPTLYFTAF